MPADGENRGLGWTHQMVRDWQPPARSLQMDYFEQVRSALREYLPALTEAQMQQTKVIPPVSGTPHRSGRAGPDDLGLRFPRRPDRLPAGHVQRHGLAPVGAGPLTVPASERPVESQPVPPKKTSGRNP